MDVSPVSTFGLLNITVPYERPRGDIAGVPDLLLFRAVPV